MRAARAATVILATLILGTLVVPLARAGSPHFTAGQPTIARVGDDLVVGFKVAGLGNETQIRVEVTATVQCVNRGGNEPAAENKEDLIATGTFPVQNGKAEGTLTGRGETDPDCAPPMRLVYRNVTVTVSGASFATFSFTSPEVF